MTWAVAGIIEGFYGRPWTWDERADVMRFCHDRGMRHYVYAPKDDPKHRADWRSPYKNKVLDGFARLAAEDTLQVGFGISPGLSMDYASPDDRAALAAKVDQVVGVGVGLVCLALDDIPFGGADQGIAHAAVTTWLRNHLGDRAGLVLVPTEYVGLEPTAYLDALAEGVPDDVPIAWTGDTVVNATITADQAGARAAALGGRPPLVWDNYPVNDGIMTDRLHLGPLWGRDAGLADQCCGYLANPLVQPRSSLLPLASIAAWLQGDDPLSAWAAEAERMQVRVFAEACDGAVPQALVEHAVEWIDDDRGFANAAAPLREWLVVAAACTAPGLEDEAGPWLEQAHTEAQLGLDALRLVDLAREGRFGKGIEIAFGIGITWGAVRRADKTVMGTRYGLQPALGQRADGTWSFRAESVMEDENAIDAVVRAALNFFASRSSGSSHAQ
jgi:hyaluronoglucosaminidase